MKPKAERDTQGKRANDTGAGFEAQFRAALQRKGYRELSRAEVNELKAGKPLKDVDGEWFVEQANLFTNIYGARFKADFLFVANGIFFLVEMKWQQTGGSVDEKYPFVVSTLKTAAAQYGLKAVFVLAGGGARPSAIKWCREQADTSLIVLSPGDELLKWANKGFRV